MVFFLTGWCFYCMGFAQHLPCRGKKWAEKVENKNFIVVCEVSEEAAPGGFPTHHDHEVHLNCFGVMLKD